MRSSFPRQPYVWADIHIPDSISGLEWVDISVRESGRPSVAVMSFSGGYDDTVNDAAAKLVSSGVTTVVSAGNNGVDAGDYSPGTVPSVLTIGSTGIDDLMSQYSNFGSILDIFAPGM